MQRILENGAFNPSSLHAEGRAARAILDDARDRVARTLGASRKEIVFTASGTESDGLALLGTARARGRGHIVAGATEHRAVLAALERLRDEGFEVSLIPVDAQGRIQPRAFEAALRPDTVLASVMYANNEIGTLAPIAALAEIARARDVRFHTDAVQAPEWRALDVAALGVDLLSLSAHKFGGPTGAGVLYARTGTELQGVIAGGGQEFGRRAGTEHLLAIVGLALALELAAERAAEASRRIAALQAHFESTLLRTIPDARINGGGATRLPNITNVSFAGTRAEEMLVLLDLAGVAASAGSACTSGILEPSHVMAALGVGSERGASAVRFSLGPSTSAEEIERVLELLPRVVAAAKGNSVGGAGRAE